MKNFVHLHVHSQYSILDGACKVSDIVKKAKEFGMPAVALTDHGNMYGIAEFYMQTKKQGIKPIIGVEAYVAEKSMEDRTPTGRRRGYHLILLAKNLTGYHNLMKLVSYAHLFGFYYNPRMDKALLRKYHEGLIASSACLGGEIPQKILSGDMDGARKAIEEYLDIFGDDFYLELMRHKTGDPEKDKDTFKKQEYVNKYLIELAKEYNIKLIATNDVHFLNPEDFDTHKILICLNTGRTCDEQNKKLVYTGQEFFASPDYMWDLFSDIPQALENTMEIADKVEVYSIEHDPIMPIFEIPPEFKDDNEYLRYLTYEGAKERWGEPLPDEIKERLEFELGTIEKMGFSSYFLIVWDFIRAAREMGVWVGPGRGSAAGSAVAYCLKIIEIDPIKYDLLFERFLNPDRISMPDIDVDFDEDGRDKVLEYVAQKYGRKRVANIITFGTMAMKSAIRDVARVLGYPIPTADKLTKMIPDKVKTFKEAYAKSEEFRNIRQHGTKEERRILEYAEKLEGSVRQKGVHACGVIIGRDDLENFIPLTQTKDSVLFASTQYEGSYVESVGMLKMDFLGLRTLSVLKDAVENIKHSKGVEIDFASLPLDDKETYDLFSRGDTIGLFQFESAGMRKYLKELKPQRIDDLIAMNALYRPGPLSYIPKFIARKNGQEKIEYDLPQMKEILENTYGITVYQEQVMLLSQKLAGFTRGEADSLRKAMGKKKKDIIDKLKPKFIEGCQNNGIDPQVAEKIWNDWEKFASYAFNKSHSTCYAYLAYHTGYLKAHYPAEFMAALLSRKLNDIKKIAHLMDECRRMKIEVLGPDVNESFDRFFVNKRGAIRFALAAIKGVGKHAAEEIVREREEHGPFKDIYDFVERIDLQVVNKRVLESLVISGAIDNISPYPRAQYFAQTPAGTTLIEDLIKYGQRFQSFMQDSANSLFGETKVETKRPEPKTSVEEWSDLERLNRERELIGIYLSAHPLDNDKPIIQAFTNTQLTALKNLNKFINKDIKVAGVVTSVSRNTSKSGNPYGRFVLEDYSGSHEFVLFGDTFVRLFPLIMPGAKVLLIARVYMRNGDEHNLDMKIVDIKPLSELKIERIIIRLLIEQVGTPESEQIIDFLSQGLNGGPLCEFYFLDPEDKVDLPMKVKTFHVKDLVGLMNYLDENHYKYKLVPAIKKVVAR